MTTIFSNFTLVSNVFEGSTILGQTWIITLILAFAGALIVTRNKEKLMPTTTILWLCLRATGAATNDLISIALGVITALIIFTQTGAITKIITNITDNNIIAKMQRREETKERKRQLQKVLAGRTDIQGLIKENIKKSSKLLTNKGKKEVKRLNTMQEAAEIYRNKSRSGLALTDYELSKAREAKEIADIERRVNLEKMNIINKNAEGRLFVRRGKRYTQPIIQIENEDFEVIETRKDE